MKNITEIRKSLHIAQHQIQPQQAQQAMQLNDFAARNINNIFKSLCQIFPNWRNVYRDADELQAAKNTFTKGMMENGIVTSEQVKRGLAKARSQESDFFPSVGKFCAWCRDDTQWQSAFQRMLTREPAQNLVEKKARTETSWQIRNSLNAADAEKKFKQAYEKYQALEQQGLLVELQQLPARSSVTEFDKKRNATTVRPEQFRESSVFARVAAKGMTHE
ncbi:replication protein P [Photobacterium leiognathi subsp. mandapamensis]|uniref:replication protein P n=1 Tax=Photobacterium leiognathi TaxID=553611 RepID=UPI003AF3CC83